MRYQGADKDLLRRLGLVIRVLRSQKGWSQEHLALECGLERTYMGDIERGERNVAIVNLKRVADALGITLSQLFATVERYTPPEG